MMQSQFFSKDGNFLCPDCGTDTEFDIHIRKCRCPKCGKLYSYQLDNDKFRVQRWGVIELNGEIEL